MDRFAEELNELIVETFRSINKMEEQTIRRFTKINLSISELHLIEAVARGGERGRTISDLAVDQEITLPSVTVAINKLVRKGYVEKVRSESDGRVVYVKLTRQGRKVNSGHQYFHKNLARGVASELSDEEKQILIKGVTKINGYFVDRNEALEKKLEEKGIR
ncbi:MarR family winged helix-turn-helix transcriptional regulator [Bacilliculturomica massiliensis]|uniref:MarR family winged helix-turn-helix transcriptional regulator n=1 Tax=Bacilliculturomica massiliensis TaxID=1917867 RepID=UPI00103042E6|nr:MarR family transcriptional regulator [Bacilliculturomica massiliensis]